MNRACAGGGGASFKVITSPVTAVGGTAAAAFDKFVTTLAGAAGFREASLGRLILRTETAVVAALASLNYALGA